MQYESLESLITPYLSEPFDSLPDDVAARVQAAFAPMFHWDNFQEGRRLHLIQQHDYQHDPATESERAYYFDISCLIADKKADIEKYEAKQEPTTLGEIAKEQKLNQLRTELAELAEKLKAPYPAAPVADTEPPKPKAAHMVTESPKQRRARWLDWYGDGARGAKQQVYERELLLNPKADRSFICKQIEIAKTEKTESNRGGAMFGQLFQNGKPKG